MRQNPILHFLDKLIHQNIYQTARQKERSLSSDRFTAYYSYKTVLYWGCLCFLFVLFTVILGAFDKAFFWLLFSLSVLGGFITLYHLTYRCHVDDNGMTITRFWIFTKHIAWEEVKKIETKPSLSAHDPDGKLLLLRNEKHKILYSCSNELVGFCLIAKKAKKERKKKHKTDSPV